MDNVLVLFETDSAFREELKSIFTGCKIIFNESNNTSSIDKETAENTTVILGNPKVDFLGLCPRLKWLHIQSAGANDYVNGELKESVMLTSSTGCYGQAVSEHMLALTVSLLKKLPLYRDEQTIGRSGSGAGKKHQEKNSFGYRPWEYRL